MTHLILLLERGYFSNFKAIFLKTEKIRYVMNTCSRCRINHLTCWPAIKPLPLCYDCPKPPTPPHPPRPTRTNLFEKDRVHNCSHPLPQWEKLLQEMSCMLQLCSHLPINHEKTSTKIINITITHQNPSVPHTFFLCPRQKSSPAQTQRPTFCAVTSHTRP